MSDENYRNLSQQLADFRKDMDARQTALQISIAKIITWQKALTAGLVAAGVIATSIIGLIMFLHSEQTTSINRMEDFIVSQRNTTCQCDKTKANNERP